MGRQHISLRWPRAGSNVLAPALVLLLAGCGAKPGQELFPLDAGHRWTYRLASEMEGGATDSEIVRIATLGSESLPNGAGSAMRRRSASGMDYWLRSDASGIWRVASKSDVMAEPALDPAEEAKRRYVLKAPIAVGTSWQADTTTYLLRRRAEFPPEIRHSHPKIPMSYRIEALGQVVQTQAGRFEGCVKVQGTATLKLFADPVVGWTDLPLSTTEWYCPGVGLARLERVEPANSSFLQGGKLVMDLQDWQ
ncbi:MAG: hypothetical protein RL722_2526 [Pseudomonadota bacterium]|jgi:hypothetical protein